jgi:hypothetical protein
MGTSQAFTSFSIFEPKAFGHGGEKRTFQIRELLKDFSQRQVTLPFSYEKKPLPFKKKMLSIPYVFKSGLWTKIRRNGFDHTISRAYHDRLLRLRILRNSAPISESNFVIWESTFPEFYGLPGMIEHLHKPVIACPHNLESLALPKASRQLDNLKQEIDILRGCTNIFVISEEEEWLLNCAGISASYLPYYPLGELYESLIKIRNLRQVEGTDDYFLIAGSITNPPTRKGMMQLLNRLKRLNSKGFSFKVKLTGFGTNDLKLHYNDSWLEILGDSNAETFTNLVRNCKAMLIEQGFSSGALTKIPEMLTAGVPIICDHGSSRSFRTLNGLHIFDNDKILFDFISEASFDVPEIPVKPDERFGRFIDILKTL